MTSTEIVIRKAEIDDLSALVALYQHLNPGDEAPASDQANSIFESFNRFEGSAILVATIGEQLAGSCTLIVIPNLTRGGKPYGLIENVVTHSSHRGIGIGKRLLQAASKAAQQENCYKLMLMTGRKEPEVLNFYLSAGFEQSKTGFQKRM